MRDGLPATYPALDQNLRTEVAIIGGGVSGALLALHLAEAGIETVVLDRRDVAHGSTAASTGLLQYELDEPLHKLAQKFGEPFAVRCYRRCLAAIDGLAGLVNRHEIACGFERRPGLLLASDRTHLARLRREFEARDRAGFAVEWWSREKLRASSTLPHPAAIRSRDGAQVDAYALTHGLLAAAQRAGARIFDRTAVTRWSFQPRGVTLRTEHGHTVRARHLVVATGYEAGQFLPAPVTALHSTFAMVSEPVEDFEGWPPEHALLWETARPYLYLRTTADRRVMMGGYDEEFADPAARDRMLPAKCSALARRFRQLFPRIKLEVATAWAGTFADTEAGLPFIGRHPKVPHTWFALGYGGNGITFSLIAAEIIRDALRGKCDPDAQLFDFDREPQL